MKPVKVCVVHFQPLEKYPPVMNLLNYFSNKKSIDVNVYSINDLQYKEKLFQVPGACISRIGFFSKKQSSFIRYLQYIKFNIGTVLFLIFKKPQILLCYETISIFPVYIYKKLFPSTHLYIHYHEYTALYEYEHGSQYLKWLFGLERRLYEKANWISHTNLDRLRIFQTDHPNVHFKNLKIMPNYPPGEWYDKTQTKNKISNPIKFVYVGALGIDSMYIKEFAKWIQQSNGTATWDIYTGNYTIEALDFINSLNCSFISIKSEVDYFTLPEVLSSYDIGIILYNGNMLNYVYNVPNKLLEYHVCGLDVWFSNDLKSSLHLETLETYPKIISINFKNLNNLNLHNLIDRREKVKHKLKLQASEAFEPLLQSILNIYGSK